jgi:hypothetical protein
MSFLKTLRSILPTSSPNYSFDSTVRVFEYLYDRGQRAFPGRDRNAWLAGALHGRPGWKQPIEALLVVTAPYWMTAEETGPATALALFMALSAFRDRFPSEAPTPEAADVYNERADKFAALCRPVLKLATAGRFVDAWRLRNPWTAQTYPDTAALWVRSVAGQV